VTRKIIDESSDEKNRRKEAFMENKDKHQLHVFLEIKQ
jgi:hypothetical protein